MATEVKLEVIGLSGKAGVGKDFIGRQLLSPLGYHQWAFAWPMKNEACGSGFSYEEVHEQKPPEVRAWLQRRGTEDGWMKNGRMYWCNIAGAWLRTIAENWGIRKFFFTDVRFEHEAEFIKALGGKIVRILPGDRTLRLSGEAAQHISETALDAYPHFDFTLVNNLGKTPMVIASELREAGIL